MLNCMTFYAIIFFHFTLDGQKTERIFRCIDSQRGAALGRQKMFYAKLHNILCRWYWSWRVTADSPKIEGINGNRPLRAEEIHRNRATIALAKFLSALPRVRTGLSGLPCFLAPDWVGPKSGRRWSANAHFLDISFKFLALTVRIPLFKCAWHKHRKVDSSLDR